MLVRVYIWPLANIVDLKMYKHINKLENHLYIYFVIFFVAFCVFIYTDVTQKNIRMPHVPNILYIHKNSHSIQIQDGLQPFHSIILYLFSQTTSRKKQTNMHTYTTYIDLLLWPMLPYQSMHNLNHEFNVFFLCFWQLERFRRGIGYRKESKSTSTKMTFNDL